MAETRQAPEHYRVRFDTTRGPFEVEVRRAWAPHGADRFHHLIQEGFFDGVRFFRVIEGFVAQFGIPPEPSQAAAWRERRIPDDAVRETNARGRITFAMAGPGTRTTQLFINTRDNPSLDSMGFAPIGEVVEGMDVVDGLHAGYGEGAPSGRGPDQRRIQLEGNAYLAREFAELDAIETARLVGTEREGGAR